MIGILQLLSSSSLGGVPLGWVLILSALKPQPLTLLPPRKYVCIAHAGIGEISMQHLEGHT